LKEGDKQPAVGFFPGHHQYTFTSLHQVDELT
jgi:hypothetical protein